MGVMDTGKIFKRASKGKSTYDSAKAGSFEKADEILANFDGAMAGKPSDWIVKKDDTIYISWRISNKPVYFNQQMKDKRSGLVGFSKSEAKGKFEELYNEIKAGDYETVLLETYNRPQNRKKKETVTTAE